MKENFPHDSMHGQTVMSNKVHITLYISLKHRRQNKMHLLSRRFAGWLISRGLYNVVKY